MENAATSSDKSVLRLAVTWALMIPLTFLASNGTFWFQALARNNPLSAENGTLVNSHHFFETLAVAAIVFSIIVMAAYPRLKDVTRHLIKDRLFASLAALAVLSTLWSQFPGLSLSGSLCLVFDTLFIFYVFCRFTQAQQMRLLYVLGWFCVVFSVVLAVAFPDFGIDHTGESNGAWRGMYGQKNVGAMATLYMLPAGFFLPSEGLLELCFRWAYAAFSLLFIIMSQSMSSVLAMVLLVVFVGSLQALQRFDARSKAVLLFCATAIALCIAFLGLTHWDEIAYFLGKDPTLTGRTQIWHATWVSIIKRPLLGYGYQAFWQGYRGESANVSLAAKWSVTSAHNGFLEVWLTLGLVGIGLVLTSILRSVRHAYVCFFSGATPYVKWCLCIVFLTIVTCLDEGELMMPNNLMWALFMLACLGLAAQTDRARLGH